jgi:hypothetical protein
VRRVAAVVLATAGLASPAPARADVRLGGELVALSAGRGSAYAVVATGTRNVPFRRVRSGGRRASSLGGFGSLGAEFADVAAGAHGPVTVFARPTSEGFEYETTGSVGLGEGTGPPVLALDGDAPLVAYPDEDGDVVLGTTPLTDSGPVVRHAPLDVADRFVLDLAQSITQSQLRVLGGPDEPVASARGVTPIEATIARDDTHLYVAYRIGDRLALATARASADARWTRRRIATRGELNGAPAVVRAGGRTLVATSQRTPHRRGIYLTTGARTRRLTKPRGSDLSPLAAKGPDGRVYVAWTRRSTGHHQRTAHLRRVR